MNDKVLALDEMDAEVGARDKQPAKPEPINAERQIAADAARRESERLAKRKEIRAQIKQRAVLMQQLADLEAELRLCDLKADALAAIHQERTGPIQAGLSTASGTKRAGLLQKLSEANYELEQGLLVVERMRGPLRKQHQNVGLEYAKLPTEQRLCSDDLASPALRAEKFATQQRLAAAEQRVARARDWVAAFDSQLQLASSRPSKPTAFGWTAEHSPARLDFDRIDLLSFRLRKWKAELTAAAQEVDAAQRTLADLAAQMRAE